MRPLQSIAMGLVVIVLDTLGRVDALPDPLGWALVLYGLRGLPRDLGHLRPLHVLALLAGAVSVVLWLPGAVERLDDAHPSLLWAANLPQLGFAGLLCLALARRAAAGGDASAAGWARTTLTGVVAVAVLPVLVFGGGAAALEVPAYVAASLVLVLLIWLLFSWSSRSWIFPTDPTRAPGPT